MFGVDAIVSTTNNAEAMPMSRNSSRSVRETRWTANTQSIAIARLQSSPAIRTDTHKLAMLVVTFTVDRFTSTAVKAFKSY